MKLANRIFIAIALGAIVGMVAWDRPWLQETAAGIEFLGTLFLNMLKMVIAPLILASVTMGVAGIGDVRSLGKIGSRTVGYYLITTAISVFIGLVLVNVIQPGVGASIVEKADLPDRVLGAADKDMGDVAIDMLLGLFANPFKALATGDVLPIIVFSILLGGIITTLGERGEVLKNFFDGLNMAIMKLVDLIMLYAPVGVFALMASIVANSGSEIFVSLGKYMATVIIGLAVHGFIVLPLILKFVGKMSPMKFFEGMRSALAVAFSTSSSSATLPVTIDCMQDNLGVSKKTTSFVLPLGATINMDGTALYESVAAMFIAQAYGIDMSLPQQFIIFFTATTAAIGAAGIPGAGLVTMAIVLNAVGLPLDGIGLILAVDRILDMCRTTINVEGDAIGTVVIDRLEQGDDVS